MEATRDWDFPKDPVEMYDWLDEVVDTDSSVSISNTVIINNTATDEGGGIYLGYNLGGLNNSIIVNSTIAMNSANYGGGIYCG